MSGLDTLPGSIDIGTGETAPYTIDVTNSLLTGESLQTSPAPTAKVISNSNNATISGAISGSLSVSGNQIIMTLVGSVLSPKQVYTLIVGYNTSASKTLQSKTTINVII